MLILLIHYATILCCNLIFEFVDIDSLGSIIQELRRPISPHWQEFAIQLGLSHSTMEIIRLNYPNNATLCLQEVLAAWLRLDYDYQRLGRPSWRKIAEAVESFNRRLFHTILTNHRM